MTTEKLNEILNNMSLSQNEKIAKIQALHDAEESKSVSTVAWWHKGVMLFFFVIFIGWQCIKKEPVSTCTINFDKYNAQTIKLKTDSTFDWCKVHPDSVKQQHFRYLFD
jgi:hypothetical protein